MLGEVDLPKVRHLVSSGLGSDPGSLVLKQRFHGRGLREVILGNRDGI